MSVCVGCLQLLSCSPHADLRGGRARLRALGRLASGYQCFNSTLKWTLDVSLLWFNPFHNFQRWMSRLKQRWRAQRSVIIIVNCRVPWTNRSLNVSCAARISLAACLLQCLYLFMCFLHVLCAPPPALQGDAFRICFEWSWQCVKGCMSQDLCPGIVSKHLYNFFTYWHEVRSANPLNLSI